MTVACGNCATCGKCYAKIRPCPRCGATADFSLATCPTCRGEITEEMREKAAAEYREEKKRELASLFNNRETGRPSLHR